MRVLVVMPCYRPATRFGGPIKSVHALAVELHSLGHEVTVFTTSSNGTDDLDVATSVPHAVDGVIVTYFPVTWPRSYFRSPLLRAALRMRIRDFDLVYLPWLYVYTTMAAARESARQGVPYVISPRGMLDRNMVERKGRLKKKAYLSLVEDRHFRGAAAIHFTSAIEREISCRKFEEGRSLVIPNGLDAADLDPSSRGKPDLIADIPTGKHVVLFLGRLSYIKGLDALATAWPIVARSVPSAHLVLAGPDDEGLYDSFRQVIETANVMHSVSYVGLVDEARKLALLSECVLLAAPSHSDSFGMSVLEAMAKGKPVVVSAHVGISPEIAASGAGRVVPAGPEELARAMIEIIRDPGAARAMGAAGRRLVEERFSIPAVARRIEAAFLSVIGRRA